jgi:hypothetical protein
VTQSNMTPVVDLRGRRDEVLSALREVVGERPDHTYLALSDLSDLGACRYTLNGSPSCLVGHVLHRVGVPIETLEEFDLLASASMQALVDGAPGQDSALVMEDDLAWALMAAQEAQDAGRRWGDALDCAEATL